MRIAQIAPPWVSVPPNGYGGVERIIATLCDELVKRGHKVTLFASGDSKTKATLSSVYKEAVGNNFYLKGNALTTLYHIYPAFEQAQSFDIIHSHDLMTLFFSAFVPVPSVHTLHGPLYEGQIDDMKRKVYQQFKNQNFISISNDQKKGLPDLNYVATVYNSIPIEEFPFVATKGRYVAWLGRVTPEKRSS